MKIAVALLSALLILISAQEASSQPPYDEVEQAIYTAFQQEAEVGGLFVEIARCEGWNAVAEWDLAHISNSGDVGPLQINQIHGQRGGVIEGRWPSYVQNLSGNIEVGLILYRQGGLSPWANSRHCWGRWLGLPSPSPTPTPTAPPMVVILAPPIATPTPTPTPWPTPIPTPTYRPTTEPTPLAGPISWPPPTPTPAPIQKASGGSALKYGLLGILSGCILAWFEHHRRNTFF